jgi:hypothetical protein
MVGEVDGKQLSKLLVKDIGCSSNCLFMATGKFKASFNDLENGEVIVGRVKHEGQVMQ